MAPPIRLIVRRGGALVSTHDFEAETIRIGRLATAHLRLDDPKVSRIHAVIEVTPCGSVSVIDMGSAEGTLLDGKKVNKAALSSGDRIALGESEIEVRFGADLGAAVEEAAAATTPAPAPSAPPAGGGNTPAAGATGPVAPKPAADGPAASPAAARPSPGGASAPAAAGSAALASAAAPAGQPGGAGASASGAGGASGSAASVTPSRAARTPAAASGGASAPAPAAVAEAAPAAAPTETPAPAAQEAAAAPLGAPSASASLPARPAGASALPTPWPASESHRPLALQVRVTWGDQPLDTASFHEEEVVTLGGPKASLPLHVPGLEGEAETIARKVDGTWVLRLPPGTNGGWMQGERVRPLAELARRGEDDRYEVDLPLDAAAWVDWGALRLEFFYRPVRKRVEVGFWEKVDQGFAQIFLVVAFVTAFGVVAFENMEPARRLDASDELYNQRARFTRLLLVPPEKQAQNPFLQKVQKQKEKLAKAKGEEGKMGKADAPERVARSAPRAVDPNDREVVKNQGLLGVLGKGSAGLSTIFGNSGLGGDLAGAIGGIQGKVGDARGFGGLGLKGTGQGGGATGETVAVGAIGTRGRGGGEAGFGSGVGGLGKKSQSEVSIDSSGVMLTGSIDRELVRRVINSHQAKIKYCYESELVRNPKLAGRVAYRFIIGSDGKVSMVQVQSSTLGSPTVETCIANRIRQMVFPAPKGGGGAQVTYPWVFKPVGA